MSRAADASANGGRKEGKKEEKEGKRRDRKSESQGRATYEEDARERDRAMESHTSEIDRSFIAF